MPRPESCGAEVGFLWDLLLSPRRLMTMGYFVAIMGYFGVYWPIVLGYLAFQVHIYIHIHRLTCDPQKLREVLLPRVSVEVAS